MSIPTVVYRRNDEDGVLNEALLAATLPSATNVIAAQKISTMFLTFADRGLHVGETFYGYSIMATDVNITAF